MIQEFFQYSATKYSLIIISLVITLILLRIVLTKIINTIFKVQLNQVLKASQRKKLINSTTLSLVLGMAYLFLNQSRWSSSAYLPLIEKFILILLSISIYRIVLQLLNLTQSFYTQLDISKTKSIKPLLQVAQLVLAIVIFLIVVGIIIETNPLTLIAGASAVTAIFGLIFKDIILSFYAGMYLTSTDMIQIGNYIYVSSHNVSGTVEDIGMTHVSVRNLDNSTTTIPSYVLLQNDIQNYSTIKDEQGRRINKTLLIDPTKIVILETDKISAHKKKYNLPVESRIETNADLLCATIRQYMLQQKEIKSDSSVLAILGNQTLAGVELKIIASTTISNYESFNLFESSLVSKVVFYVNHFELQKNIVYTI